MASIAISRDQLEKAASAHYGCEYSDWDRLDAHRKDQLIEQMEVAFEIIHIEVRDV